MEQYDGKDPLAEWCAKEMKLDIDGNALVIKPTMEHYRKLKVLMNSEPNITDEEKVEKASKADGILKDILKTTFPDSASVDDFMERYENKFQLAIYAEIIGITQEALKKKFTEAVENQKLNLPKNKD